MKKAKMCKMKCRRYLCEVVGVGCMWGYSDGEKLWYNSKNPDGCAFIPKNDEDVENFDCINKYGEYFEVKQGNHKEGSAAG